MLNKTLFFVKNQQWDAGTIKATLLLNGNHDILQGHFPGQPVLPGVCMMQIVKELVELQSGRKLLLKNADNMKFLSVIDPRRTASFEADITVAEDSGNYKINASLFDGNVTFFKLKATLAPQ